MREHWRCSADGIRRAGFAMVATGMLLLACDAKDEASEQPPPALVPDSATAVRTALDTLHRAGAKDWIADSLVRRGDTVAVWAGPRVWMATDRPMSVVSIVRPARVVAIRHIFGG